MSVNNRTKTYGRLIVALACAATLGACATATRYQPAQGNDKHGYSEQKLENNRYRVSFSGNSETDRDTVQNYLLYRAAELTLAQGGDYFIVSNQDTDKNINQTSVYTGTGFGSPFFFGPGFGGTASTNVKTNYTAYGIITIHKGSAGADQADAYNAEQVESNLKSKIERPK